MNISKFKGSIRIDLRPKMWQSTSMVACFGLVPAVVCVLLAVAIYDMNEEEKNDDDVMDEEEEESENNLVCGEGEHPPLGIDNQIGGKVWSQSMRAVKKWL